MSIRQIVLGGVSAKLKEVLPVFEEGGRDGLRKDFALPAAARGAEVYQASKRRSLTFAARIRGLPHQIPEPSLRRHCGTTARPAPATRAHCPARWDRTAHESQFGERQLIVKST